jgi:hypothetical protein
LIKDYAGTTLGTYPIVADALATPLDAGTLIAGNVYTFLWIFGYAVLYTSSKAVSQTIAADEVKTVNLEDNAVTLAKMVDGTAGRGLVYDAGGSIKETDRALISKYAFASANVAAGADSFEITGIKPSVFEMELDVLNLAASADVWLGMQLGDGSSYLTNSNSEYNGVLSLNEAPQYGWETAIGTAILDKNQATFGRCPATTYSMSGRLKIILDYANDVAHIRFDGGYFITSTGNGYTNVGCCGQVSLAGKTIDRIKVFQSSPSTEQFDSGSYTLFVTGNPDV